MFRATSVLQGIVNRNAVPCITCIHYRRLPNTDISKGECAMYGTKDLVTGLVKYEEAKSVRYNEIKCGKEGKDYQPLVNGFIYTKPKPDT